MRDQAQTFEQNNCSVLGISFDTPEENRSFREKFSFPFPLLSDSDQLVGEAYQAKRAPNEEYGDFPRRVSYLINPAGTIAKSYEVTDPAGHADTVLADLEAENR